ncbi:MAG: bifunctional diguanylate cyclase/phosphodiesterase [Lachnospiraceae bacterium]
MNQEIQVKLSNMMDLFPCGLMWSECSPTDVKEGKIPKFELANSEFYQLVGIPKDEFEEKYDNQIGPILVQKDRQRLRMAYQQVLENRTPESLIFTINSPSEGPISVTANIGMSTRDETGTTMLTVIQDITSTRRKEQDLEQQIKMDLMTGLYNKVAVEEIIKAQITAHTSGVMALLMIDIDNFKTVNDTFGHMFGDVVIRDIAENITASFPQDTVIGRFGGDEFLIFIDKVDEGELKDELEVLCQKISYEYLADSGILAVGCSIGYTLSQDRCCDFETMFIQADTAMYFSKENGKSKYTRYSHEMQNMRKQVAQKREHTEDFYDAKIYDMEFVSSAYSLLSDSKYIESSITMLLRKIAERYDLYAVNVFEYDESMKRYYRGNSWSEGKDVRLNDADAWISHSWLEEQFGDRDIFCIGDVDRLEQETVKIMKSRDYHAFTFCKMPDSPNVDGCVCMTAKDWKRDWKEFELATFEELAKAVSIFVSLDKERTREKAIIEKMVSTDQLTGLLTKKSFENQLNDYMAEQRKRTAAILYLDISNFSYINERYGYEAGNEVLRTIAKTIISQKQVKMAARAYSDCFIVLKEDISQEAILLDVNYMVSVILRVLAQKYTALNVQIKIGIYALKESDCHAYLAIENANMARKNIKGNTITVIGSYKDELRTMRDASQKITAELLKVLREDELKLYFQPKFSLHSREVSGLEAFARWYTQSGRLRQPSEFVEALELSGYITELDFAIYEKVLQTLQRWKRSGRKLYVVSVNFSGVDCIQKDFVRKIIHLAKKYEIEPKWIEVEIAANELEKNWELLSSFFQSLREYGFRTAIDNFGAGYSSMKLLLNNRFDVVKIDRNFLLQSEDAKERKNYMKYISTLIDDVRQQVVFVGTETNEHADELLECGYNYAQGYLFEKVISMEKFEESYCN